jgi:hypothetical protein
MAQRKAAKKTVRKTAKKAPPKAAKKSARKSTRKKAKPAPLKGKGRMGPVGKGRKGEGSGKDRGGIEGGIAVSPGAQPTDGTQGVA